MHITIIGTGLIGTSLGLALREKGHVVSGSDNNPRHLQQALHMGALDAVLPPAELPAQTGLLVLCLPVDAILKLLPTMLDSMPPHCVLMDMGSTKLEICTLADTHPRRPHFVAAHPMAGTEHSGPGAARPDLFARARVILCDAHRSQPAALDKVSGILQELQMEILTMEAAAHDRQLALVSHLPQFIAYALASMDDFREPSQASWTQLGGGGLKSSIRLGKSDAAMWMPIFHQNKENLLHFVEKYIGQLQEMKRLVESGGDEELKGLIREANENYGRLIYQNTDDTDATDFHG